MPTENLLISKQKNDSTLSTANLLLKALPSEVCERSATHLEPIEMSPGEVIYRPDETITHVYFPNRGTVSIICTVEDGEGVEAESARRPVDFRTKH